MRRPENPSTDYRVQYSQTAAVAQDGRFLLNVNLETAAGDVPSIKVIVNWEALVKKMRAFSFMSRRCEPPRTTMSNRCGASRCATPSASTIAVN